MAWIIWPTTKIVSRYKIAKGGIEIIGHGFMPDTEVDNLNHRIFTVHPDRNSLCSRDIEGNILYQGKPLAKEK